MQGTRFHRRFLHREESSVASGPGGPDLPSAYELKKERNLLRKEDRELQELQRLRGSTPPESSHHHRKRSTLNGVMENWIDDSGDDDETQGIISTQSSQSESGESNDL